MANRLEFEIAVSKKRVLQRLGHREGIEISKGMERLIDAMLAEGRKLIAPKAVYDILDIMPGHEGIYIYNAHATKYLESKFLAKKFKGDRKAALFAATIGSRLEKKCEKLGMTESIVLDAIGSIAADESARYVNRLIADEFGLKEAERWSPGYSDWKLEEQAVIFAFLHPEKIGIRLTEGFYMLPQKSVSAIAKVQQ